MTSTQSRPDTTTSFAPQPLWAKAIAHPADEFPLTPLPVLSGQIPSGLRGTLYRNGPGRLERGNQPVGHWFDGDGAILAVHLTDGGATGTYRYVRTAGLVAEEAMDRFLFGGYGMTPPGWLWERWGRPVKNAANTSVLALPDRLLALWEGGNPHALDRQTLKTLGRDDLGSALDGNLPYSAHPKVDPATGDIFNFGVAPGLNSSLNLYRSDRTGKVLAKAQIPLQGTPLVHDCVLAGPYLVFCAPPVHINLLPVALCLRPFSDAMDWKPSVGTEIVVIDRETLAVVGRSETDPWFQWHFSNGYVDAEGAIVLDVIRYPDFQTNEFLREVATGRTQTLAKGTFWRLRIDPKSGRLLSQEERLERSCEFPVVRPQEVGQPTDAVYLSIHRPDADLRHEIFEAIARFNPETNHLVMADLGTGRYPTEPLYAADAHDPNQGWILTVVFDGHTETSEVWIFDEKALDAEPVCRLGLPSIVPPGFHGTWAG
ncbi:MAG: carotenoid oxygenase family protein [Synechococcales bacterium]|nr:carotenoid oxygenase family protein [Synechococcales bacterium]